MNLLRAAPLLKEVNKAHLAGRDFKGDLGSDVLVVGGGNTALNAAMAVRLLGVPNVTVVYWRTEMEMPAWGGELETARRHGVNFHFLLEPVLTFLKRDL